MFMNNYCKTKSIYMLLYVLFIAASILRKKKKVNIRLNIPSNACLIFNLLLLLFLLRYGKTGLLKFVLNNNGIY